MKKAIYLILVIAIPFFMASCEEESDSGPGVINLSITDSPVDSTGIEGVYITVTGITIHTPDGNWDTIPDFEGPKLVNLLDLTRGVSELLGSFVIDAGRYTQIRFMLDAPEAGMVRPSNPGCYIAFRDGTTQPLFIPSGARSGFKAVGAFTVPVNGTVNITADFDVRKSIIRTRSRFERYLLKPVIRLVVEDQAGRIRGEVTNIPEETGVIVYAYEDGTYNANESIIAPADTIRFPEAVSSDMVDSLGIYHIAFLAQGKYDLIVTSLLDSDFDEVLGIVEDVSVESRRTTLQNIDINLFAK